MLLFVLTSRLGSVSYCMWKRGRGITIDSFVVGVWAGTYLKTDILSCQCFIFLFYIESFKPNIFSDKLAH